MDLRSHYPYWLLRHGIINSYPSLSGNISADTVIIGSGISGALVAWYLSKAGHKTVVVDRRHAGMGSTVASTSLLQYEIDTPLYELTEKVGERNAIRSYQLCRQAIYTLEAICRQFNDPGLFRLKPSMQFASFKKDVAGLRKEYQCRKKADFSVNWLDEKFLSKKFHFRKPAGILSKDGAETDAYRLTHHLLEKSISNGAAVYDHTEITQISYPGKRVELLTSGNHRIRSKHLVIAAGYESQRYIPHKVQELSSTYAIISEPFVQKNLWYKNSLIWETAEPYLYLRTTDDNRIIIGGKDVPFSDPVKRDALLAAKVRSLEKSFQKLFPLLTFKTDYKWAGNFASTKDGLPFIGSIPQKPNTYFALGFGGNGIIFSVVAAEMIRDLLSGKKNPDAGIFSFNR
jgi:glycine/D-amino acid oxidase-like deaminating enzyme